MKGCFFACLLFGCGCVCCSGGVNGANLVDAQIKRLRDSTGLDSCAFVSDVRRHLCDIKGSNVEKRAKRLVDNVLSVVDALLDNGFDGGAIGELRLGDDDNVDAIFEWNDSGMSLFCDGECSMSNVDKYLHELRVDVLRERELNSAVNELLCRGDASVLDFIFSSVGEYLNNVCELWKLRERVVEFHHSEGSSAAVNFHKFMEKVDVRSTDLFAHVLDALQNGANAFS